jgi:hypothetical protein
MRTVVSMKMKQDMILFHRLVDDVLLPNYLLRRRNDKCFGYGYIVTNPGVVGKNK